MEPTINNNKGGIIGIIIVFLVLVIGAGTYLYYNKAEAPSQNQIEEGVEAPLASNCGLTVESPAKGAAVTFPVTVSGTINNDNSEGLGCSWIMSEGQAGLATLHFENKDGYSLPVDSKPITVANWMSTSTTFSVTLNYDNSIEQFPSNHNFKIVLTEENPSGEGTPDTLEIPVVLK